jgi:6-pyruvoyl-tetrahydropterin synthase
LDQYGMVRDFGDFKPLRDWIEEHWDHATLVADEDESLLAWLRANDQKYFVFSTNPTSETIAQTLFEIASRFLNDDRCFVCRVQVQETCTSEAVYEEWSDRVLE